MSTFARRSEGGARVSPGGACPAAGAAVGAPGRSQAPASVRLAARGVR